MIHACPRSSSNTVVGVIARTAASGLEANVMTAFGQILLEHRFTREIFSVL